MDDCETVTPDRLYLHCIARCISPDVLPLPPTGGTCLWKCTEASTLPFRSYFYREAATTAAIRAANFSQPLAASKTRTLARTLADAHTAAYVSGAPIRVPVGRSPHASSAHRSGSPIVSDGRTFSWGDSALWTWWAGGVLSFVPLPPAPPNQPCSTLQRTASTNGCWYGTYGTGSWRCSS